MQTEIVLIYTGADGARREAPVDARRFTIGRDADNDLVLDDPRVARRHAFIENFDGGVLIYDCQTEHGTLLNNAPLKDGAPLHSGDLLTLGGACDITVQLHAHDNAKPLLQVVPPATRAAQTATLTPPALIGRNVIVAALATAAVIIIVTVSLLLLAHKQTTVPASAVGNGDGRPVTAATSTANVGASNDVDPPPDSADMLALSDEEIERAATRAVQRASGDDKAYIFPPEALSDIRQQIIAYRQATALPDAFTTMQRAARSVATQARGEVVEPELVIYAALAASDDGRDPAATARALIPQLHALGATFGSTDADSSLIIIAASTDGVGSRQSHPLLATMRRLVHNSFTERNVWYLRAHGGLSDAAYRFVIRFLAVGVIAPDPRRYGVQADRLVY